MTVRQLESMIRLSEALARLHLDDEIRVQYVTEACRLLKASVIRVESDNIDMSTAEMEFAQSAVAMNVEENGHVASLNADHASMPLPKLSLKFDDYMRISNLLVHHLRHCESEDDLGGLTKSALIQWYLEYHEDDIVDVDGLALKQREVSAVIDRLVRKDAVLIELPNMEDEGSPLIVVHPNYAPN
jgi:DNA replication licensing factor MCM6